MSASPQNGLIHLPSKHSVDETMQRLEALLQERGVTVFARIDDASHQAADLRQSEGRDTVDAGRSQHRY